MDLDLSHVLGLEKTLDMTYTGREGNTVYARMPITDAFRSRFGYQAGGATAGFIEHTGGRITEHFMDESRASSGEVLLPFGTHVVVRHCRSAIAGYLYGKAEVVEDDTNERRRKVTTKVTVTDDEGLLVSEGFVTNKMVTRAYFEAKRKERENAGNAAPTMTPAEAGPRVGSAAREPAKLSELGSVALPFDADLAQEAIRASAEADKRYANIPPKFPCQDPKRRLGIRKTLDISYSVETPERVESVMPIDSRNIARFGFLAGGATMALLETTAGRLATLHADFDAGEMTFGTNMDIRHRRSGTGGYLHAVATIREVDANERRRKLVCDAVAYDDDGNVLSEGIVVSKIVKRSYWEAKRSEQEAAQRQ